MGRARAPDGVRGLCSFCRRDPLSGSARLGDPLPAIERDSGGDHPGREDEERKEAQRREECDAEDDRGPRQWLLQRRRERQQDATENSGNRQKALPPLTRSGGVQGGNLSAAIADTSQPPCGWAVPPLPQDG